MTFNGIDVSRWQGTIDWTKVKASGITSAIIKLGGSDDGVYTDKMWEFNYQNARAQGIKVGCYWFVGKQFFTTDDGIREAENCIQRLGDKVLDYPIYCDIEAPASGNKAGITAAALTFCAIIHNTYKRKVGIYGSDISGFKDRMDYNAFLEYPWISLWVARYGSQPKWATNWDIWQSSSSGSVPGINGRVDTDVFKFEKFGHGEDAPTTNVSVPAATTVQDATNVIKSQMSSDLAQQIYNIIKPYLGNEKF